jgi:hypothetical protein
MRKEAPGANRPDKFDCVIDGVAHSSTSLLPTLLLALAIVNGLLCIGARAQTIGPGPRATTICVGSGTTTVVGNTTISTETSPGRQRDRRLFVY